MEKIKTYGDLLEKIKNEEKFLLYIKSEGCSVCEADFPKVKEITNKNNYTSFLNSLSQPSTDENFSKLFELFIVAFSNEAFSSYLIISSA